MAGSLDAPLVSVVIPCYNRARYVREAIDSALAQTYGALEIIAVDDGSTDETPAVLASYGSRIRVIRQKNAGSSAARNTAIACSQGEFLAWLDSDDAWLPEKIERQVEAAFRWPQAALIHTRCVGVDENSHPLPMPEASPSSEAILEETPLFQLLDECQVMTSSCLIRRDALDSVGGGFNVEWLFAEDWELYLRLAREAPFVFLPTPLTRYRIHNESKTKDRWPHAVGQLQLRASIESCLPVLLETQDSPSLRQAISRHQRRYAAAHYRLARLQQQRGEAQQAFSAYQEAIRRDSRVFKYYTRYLSLSLALLLSPSSRNRERPLE